MNELRGAPPNDSLQSPIPGWTIDDTRLVASMRWHRSWLVAYVLAAVWNVGLPRLGVMSTKPLPPHFLVIGDIAAVAFAVLALRAFLARTVIRFTARELRIENPFAPWRKEHHGAWFHERR